ncbi:MAG: nitronate monooxygenase [Halobacteriota archaeon]|nr:nitronate monooxygenase [Halobacteriota archaeon]
MITKICDILGIDNPIIQGAMAWIGTAELASAASNAGGLGIIHPFTERGLDKEIEIAREMTKKPFGVNIPILSPGAKKVVSTVIDEGVGVVTASVGDPMKYTGKLQDEGVSVIQVVTNLKHAMRAGEAKVDAVVAQGIEAGGHPGSDEITTLTLVPQVVDALDIPVIAAGGICDSRGFAAALMLGAEGVQIGTRFIVTKECVAHQDFKQAILNAESSDTTVIGRGIFPSRVIRNEFSSRLEEMEENKKSKEMITEIERAKGAMLKGDLVEGSMWCGQSAGLIGEVRSVEEVIDEIISGAERILSRYRG